MSRTGLIGRLAGGALVGKLLGFVRELEMARVLGANTVADSFKGALTAVLLPINPLVGEMMTAGLIPLHREWQQHGRAPEQSGAIVSVFLLLGIVCAALTFALAERWVGLLLGGFSPDAIALTVRLVQVMSLSIPAAVLIGSLTAIEVAIGRSRIAMLRATVQNLGLVAGIALMAYTGDPIWMGWGFVIAFNLVAIYGGVSLWRSGHLAFAGLKIVSAAAVAAVFVRRIRSMLIIPLFEQGHHFAERLLASAAIVGTLASVEYARTLTESALFLVSIPVGYVVLTLTPGEGDALREQVRRLARVLFALMLPACIFLAVFSTDIITLVFRRGVFGDEAVRLTSGALTGIAIGLWAATAGWVLIRLLNAAGRNGMAALVIAAAFAVNIVANIFLVPRLGAFGLGLGESLRGLAMLAGTALALGCAGLLLRMLAAIAPAAIVLTAVGLGVSAGFDAPAARLAVGGACFALGILVWSAVYLPQEVRMTASKLLRRPVRLDFLGRAG